MKAQASLEFMIVMGVLTMIFLVGFNSLALELREVNQYMWSAQAADIAEKLASEINNVYLAGESSTRTVILPSRLQGGVNYSITVYRGLVSVSVPAYGREFSWRTVTRGINGSEGGLSLNPGSITLQNINGTVYLT